jgi:hypothetical protein
MGPAMIYSTPVIREILNVIKQYFEIKNLLKGATPNIRDGNIVLQNSSIQVDKIVINLLDPSNKSNQLISGAFNEIQKDQNIKDFSVTEKKDYIAKVDRKQFDYYKPFVVEEKQIREITSREILKVVSAVFAEDLKWIFIRNEGRIHANITDKQFLESVISKGEPFRSGDKLEVDLKVNQEYDKLSGNYIDKQYVVTKIHDHIKRLETQPLF